MRLKLIALLLYVFFGTSFIYAQEVLWLRQVGGAGAKLECTDITYLKNGTTVALLSFEGAIKIQSKSFKADAAVLVAAFGEAGVLKWALPIEVQAGAIKPSFITNDGYQSLWVGGHFSGELSVKNKSITSQSANSIFYIQINEDGEPTFVGTTAIHKQNASLKGSCDALGRLLLAGDFHGQIKLGGKEYAFPGHNALFLLRLDMNAQVVWSTAYQAESLININSVKLHADGAFVLMGSFNQMLDLGGSHQLIAYTEAAPFLISFDEMGNIMWKKTFDIRTYDKYGHLALDKKGNSLIGLTIQGKGHIEGDSLHTQGQDLLIVSCSSKGTLNWHKLLGGKGSDRCYAIAVDARQRIYIAGMGQVDSTFMGNITDLSGNETDAFIISLDANGKQLWTERARGSGFEAIQALYVEGENSLLFGGVFESKQFKYGGFGLVKTGMRDAYVGEMLTDRSKKIDYARFVSVFPNPSRAIVYYAVRKEFPAKQIRVSIYRVKDQPIYMEQHRLKQSFARSFNMANQPPGVYFLQVEGEKVKVTQRVIIE